MPPKAYNLHAPEGCFRAFKILIAAEYNGITVNIPTFNTKKVEKISPTGRAPVLELPNGTTIFDSNSIARYVARLRRDSGLMGDGSMLMEAGIDSWVDFCVNEIEIPACVWWYPAAGYMPFDENAYQKAKTDFSKGLTILNSHLLARTYLVSEQITLSDIVVISTLLYPFKFVCEKAYLKSFVNVVRWFNTCINQTEFKAVIGEVTMCKKELRAKGQKKEGTKKKEKEDRNDNTPAVEPSKPATVEHTYKVLDKTSPSNFIMDVWKKFYSNCDTLENTMETFWSTFDPQGWSIWHQKYNFNEENKRVFMTSNAVGGFQQRTEEIRKWAFGVMHIVGTEETSLEIQGIWLLRGDSIEPMKTANDDANWYTWTKLAGQDVEPIEEVKAQIKAYWCEENELEGKPIQDTKVFK